MITKYITKYSSNCKVCMCIRNTNVCFFSNVCMQIKLVNILIYVQILSYKYGMRYNMKGRWQPGKSASRQPRGNLCCPIDAR